MKKEEAEKKILLVCRSTDHYYRFYRINCFLEQNGFKVIALFDRHWSGSVSLEEMRTRFPDLQQTPFAWGKRRQGFTSRVTYFVRELRSYRNYLLISGQSSYYAERWLSYLPNLFQKIFSLRPGRFLLKSRGAGFVLRRFEELTPAVSAIKSEIRALRPAAVIASPRN